MHFPIRQTGTSDEQAAYRVLIVEDDDDIAVLLKQVLGGAGVTSQRVSCISDLFKVPIRDFELVILDLTLPDGDAIDALPELRRITDIPVIVLSGRFAEPDRVRALDSGANDYVVKPFLAQELLARIRSHLRTARQPRGLTASSLHVDTGAYLASVGGRPVDLTPREFELLSYLYERQDRVCRREELLLAIWRTEFLDPGVLNEYVYRLRGRLKEVGLEGVIRTRRAIGYQLVLPEETPT